MIKVKHLIPIRPLLCLELMEGHPMAEVAEGARTASGPGANMPGAPVSRRARQILAFVAVLLLVALGVAYLWNRTVRPVVRYTTVAADRGTVAPAVLSTGTVNPVTTIQIGTYVSGVIESISCDFNTRVSAGQLCAKIDPRPYQSAVDQAAAALATARAQLEKDQANLGYTTLVDTRHRGLLGRGFVSQEAVDTAHNAWAQARAQVELDRADVAQRQAQWRSARINLGYTKIVSPVDGTVVSRNVTQGQTVAASFQTPTLFLIATDLTRMQVDASVSEADIGQVAVGNEATFTVASYPQRRFAGRVLQVRLAPQTVQNVVTYDVVAGVPNPDLALRPGMTASVRIVTRRTDGVLRVPDQALRYRPTEARGQAGSSGAESAGGVHDRAAQVWVLADGAPRRVPVEVGLNDDTYAEVIAGDLDAGDPVIVAERAPQADARHAAPGGLAATRR